MKKPVMKAVLLHGYGGVDQLSYEDVASPMPEAGEVLVKVAATSVNPVDWKFRRGDLRERVPLELPAILGRDVAGTVEALGSEVIGFQPGERVMGLVNHAYAELLTAKPEALTRIPRSLEIEEAAALPLVVLTGAQLIERGVQPQSGQIVLILGALGNVGRAAVHVAKQHGMKVVAGVRASQRKEAAALQVNRVVAVDDDRDIAALGQVDAIADTVGHGVVEKFLQHLRRDGVLATVVGSPEGAATKDIRVQHVWTQPDAKRLYELAESVGRGEFSIPIAGKMKLSEVRKAQAMAEAGGISKILLIP